MDAPGMSAPEPRARGGVAGPWLVTCLAALAAGLIFDFTGAHPPAFWALAAPGLASLIGLGAALVIVAASHVARLLLTRREGGRDVRDHP
jgi:hypothetical protein